MIKRIISAVLIAALVFTSADFSVLAAEENTETQTKEEAVQKSETEEEKNAEESDFETEESKTDELINADGNIAGEEINESWGHITWAIDSNGKLTVDGTGDFAAHFGDRMPPWSKYAGSIKSAVITVTGMTDASKMFYGCYGLKDIDLSGFDTGNVTSFVSMFENCSGLTSLDVSGFDTRSATNMRNMFYRCSSLTSLDVSSFDTRNVTDMDHMFCGCRGLTNLDLSGFETGNVTYMSYMFLDCRGLTDLDLSGFDTGNVANFRGMFEYCSGLTSLDVSGFDTSSATYMGSMFYNCSSLTSLDVSGFDTSSATSMLAMFEGCSSLTSLDVSGFDTSKVINIDAMFSGCRSLEILDLSSFDIKNNAGNMFYRCEHLTTIYTPKNVSYPISLPNETSTDKWYRSDGTVVTQLPVNLNYSVALGRNHTPTEKEPSSTPVKPVIIRKSGITINGQGYAYARFLLKDNNKTVQKNTKISYSFGNESRTAVSDGEGYVQIESGIIKYSDGA